MKSKLTVITASTLVLMSMSLAVTTALPVAAASGNLKCSVLPQAICNMAKNQDGSSPNSSNSAVLALLQWAISILTAGVGIAAVAAFIYAGIMYSSADGSAEQVKKAKGVIQNTVIGLVVFAAMALVLQWVIPGGVF